MIVMLCIKLSLEITVRLCQHGNGVLTSSVRPSLGLSAASPQSCMAAAPAIDSFGQARPGVNAQEGCCHEEHFTMSAES